MASTISVIVPVYNSAQFLRSCLEHLRQSTETDYECIVVDDGSTDDSAATAREFGYRLMTRDRPLLQYAEQGYVQALQC